MVFSNRVLTKFNAALTFRNNIPSDFDIIHFHGDDYLSRNDSRRFRTFYGSAISEAIHSKKISRFMYQGLFYIFEWVSCMKKGESIAISPATKKALPLVKNIIPCGLPLEQFKPNSIKTSHQSILFIGDLNSRKRGNFLLKLFHNDIIKKYPECILTIIGPEQCSGKNIRYLGNISENELIKEYQRTWILCMPSSYEGFGVPVVEAMACGTSVIASDNVGVRDIVSHNNTGLIENDKEMGQGIIRLLSDEKLRGKFICQGQKVVKLKYDIDLIAKEYEKLYKKV